MTELRGRILAVMEPDHTKDQSPAEKTAVAPCPQCGFPMMAVRGSTHAICSNCGFKDSCCY